MQVTAAGRYLAPARLSASCSSQGRARAAHQKVCHVVARGRQLWAAQAHVADDQQGGEGGVRAVHLHLDAWPQHRTGAGLLALLR